MADTPIIPPASSAASDALAAHPYRYVVALLKPLYCWSGYLAGFCIAAIFTVTMVQIIGRLVGWNPAGLTNYASYFMAATVFCGLAHTFDAGGHIRIELFLSLAGKARYWIERLGFLASTAVVCWLTYYAWSMVSWSIALGDISEGMDATPLWIPQMTMAAGFTLFAISVLDRTARLFLLGDHGMAAAPDAL
jgi:TRAP-type C4-dicarboxylate transport system permease small subunit